nr:hypothetical protein [Tanacetum cinerariifolium]
IEDGSGSEFRYRCSVKIKDGWKAWDFVVMDSSSVLFFIDEKPKTAMPRWSKARNRATNVGKVGTSKDGSTGLQGVSSSHRGVCSGVKDNFSINAKVVRLWRQYYYSSDTLASMDMILMDQEGSRISATIGNKMVSQFESLLKTKVKAIQSVFPSKHGFSFVPFVDFVEDNVKEDQVVDVIRHIVAVGDVIHGERKRKKNRRMVVELADIEISCLRFVNAYNMSTLKALEKKSFFYGTKYVNLEKLMDIVEPCACATLATITSIEYEEGWVYTACCKCNCKAVPNDDESSSKKARKRKIRNTYKCETCGPDIIDVIPNIVDRSAYALKEKEANKPNAADYPDDLNKLIGKTLLFGVDDEVKDVNEYGSETDGDNEEPKLETTQNLKLETSSSSKDVESSMAKNVVKVEPVEVNATPPQGKCRIADVDKDKGAPSVTSRNKKKVVVSRKDK